MGFVAAICKEVAKTGADIGFNLDEEFAFSNSESASYSKVCFTVFQINKIRRM